MKKKSVIALVGLTLMGLFVIVIYIPYRHHAAIKANEEHIASYLEYMHIGLWQFKRWDLAGMGRVYPVGNDDTLVNNGKYCGIYYEAAKESIDEEAAYIHAEAAAADIRADGSTDVDCDTGEYIALVYRWPEYKHSYTFKQQPFDSYWFGLMMYYDDGKTKHPYNKEYSKEHYAIVAFPAKDHTRGKRIFIMNEERKIYWKEMEEPKYIDTYPGPDPIRHGWIEYKKKL